MITLDPESLFGHTLSYFLPEDRNGDATLVVLRYLTVIAPCPSINLQEMGCKLNGRSGSKVGKPCPLAPLTPDGTSRFLRLSRALSLSLPLPLSFCSSSPRTQPRVVTQCLPRAHPFFPDNPTYFLFSPLDLQDFTPPNHPPSVLLSEDSTPFLAVRDSSM